MAHTVIVPLVITKDGSGKDVYLYRDAVVPPQVTEAEVKRLLAGGFIAEDALAADAQPQGAPDESWKVAQLKAHAAEHGIDLGDATVKADILAAIAAAQD